VTVLGHIGGVPVEELLPTVCAGAGVLLVRARGMLRVRRHREPGQ
jgi:hypothetical protein